MNTEVKQFTDYVLSFYGKDGLYPFKCEDDMIVSIAKFYAATEYDFENDSTDRERVKQMLIAIGAKQIKKSI